jgi:hypothetical protein
VCSYLGDVEYVDKTFDLYYCEQGHGRPTLVARGSDAPHDYASGMELSMVDPVLREALERAKRRGFVPVDVEVTFGR